MPEKRRSGYNSIPIMDNADPAKTDCRLSWLVAEECGKLVASSLEDTAYQASMSFGDRWSAQQPIRNLGVICLMALIFIYIYIYI